jgi:hypothetical protein
VTTVALCSLPFVLGAQVARPATGAPEVFNAVAQFTNANGALSGTLEVHVDRYTPEFDRATVETSLREGGYPRFLTTLRNAPGVGQLMIAGGKPYQIRYARETAEASGRVIVLITDRPVFFVGGGQETSKPRSGYEVALLRLQIDGAGRGQGTMAGAARVRPDGNGGVLLDDYAEQPIALTSVTRKPG